MIGYQGTFDEKKLRGWIKQKEKEVAQRRSRMWQRESSLSLTERARIEKEYERLVSGSAENAN